MQEQTSDESEDSSSSSSDEESEDQANGVKQIVSSVNDIGVVKQMK